MAYVPKNMFFFSLNALYWRRWCFVQNWVKNPVYKIEFHRFYDISILDEDGVRYTPEKTRVRKFLV